MFEVVFNIIDALCDGDHVEKYNIDTHKYSYESQDEYMITYTIDNIHYNITIFKEIIRLQVMKKSSIVGNSITMNIPKDKQYSLLAAVERLLTISKLFTENKFKYSLDEINK